MGKAPVHLYPSLEFRDVSLVIHSDPAVERLDSHLAHRFGFLSRNHLQQEIRDGRVRVNGQRVRPSHRLHQGDRVDLRVPIIPERVIEPESVELNIVHEDSEILVINKPPNLACHAGGRNHGGTLANAIIYHLYGNTEDAGKQNPGIVHRLDKDTSGVMITAKSPRSHRRLSEQFARGRVHKDYLALVKGQPARRRGTIDVPIGFDPRRKSTMSVRFDAVDRKPSVTHYEVMERFRHGALVVCTPRTGRTHQIRVHMESIGHPLFGEDYYGGAYGRSGLDRMLHRQALHAWRLRLRHPLTEEEMTFEAEMPVDMLHLLAHLRSETSPPV